MESSNRNVCLPRAYSNLGSRGYGMDVGWNRNAVGVGARAIRRWTKVNFVEGAGEPCVSRRRRATETARPAPRWLGPRSGPGEGGQFRGVAAPGFQPAGAHGGCGPELCRRVRQCAAVARGTD